VTAATADSWYWEEQWASFREGTAAIQVSWDHGSARATMYDDGAPRTAARILALLPVTVPVVHAAWSGDMVMSTEPFDLGIAGPENTVRLVRPAGSRASAP
jgi:hypothetical protein